MKDRASAERACKDPNPIIDGRKANVNLAYLGAKPRTNVQLAGKFRIFVRLLSSSQIILFSPCVLASAKHYQSSTTFITKGYCLCRASLFSFCLC